MHRVITYFSGTYRYQYRWFLIFTLVSFFAPLHSDGQTYIGLSLNVGNRPEYTSSEGFESALTPSASLSISRTGRLDENWMLRYGAVAGIVGYKLNVVMIDTLGPNGDVSPFPDYSTFFASAEFLLGRQLTVFRRQLLIGAGVGVTTYLSSSPTSEYRVEVILPNNSLVSLFDARMSSPASNYSLFWKAAAYYDINTTFYVGVEYVRHSAPAIEGSYIFRHTQTPHTGAIRIYQMEFRCGIFYVLGVRRKS